MASQQQRYSNVQRIVVTIDDIDLVNRIIHGVDKHNTLVQASFSDSAGGIMSVPAQGERWLAERVGLGPWKLDKRQDSTDNHEMVTAFMKPGDHRIASGDGGRVFIEAPVVSGPSTAKRILGF